MGREKEFENKNEKHPEANALPIIRLAFGAIFFIPIFYLIVFSSRPFGGPNDWANFATYFSGIVTPIIALCSALLFFRSIVVQRDEFDKTRREMHTATKLQIDAENERQKLKKQQHLERTIPIARESHRALFNNIIQCNDGSVPGGVFDIYDDPFDNFLRLYCERTVHVVTMINRYLDADGDIYLILEVIGDLISERIEAAKFAERYEQANHAQYQEYSLLLDKLMDRRETELKNYSAKWG